MENEDTTEGVKLEVDNGDDGLDADVVFTETESRTADNFTPDLEGSDNANDDGWESEDHDRLRLRFWGGRLWEWSAIPRRGECHHLCQY